MAASAGYGNVGVIDRRVGCAAGEHLVGAAVAVLAIGGDLAGGDDLRMRAVRVGILRIGMAVGAENLLGRRLVRQALHVLMAVHAGKLHGGVDGVLQLLRVDEERDGLAVDVGGEGGVTVAGEAIFVFQLVLGASGEGRAQQKERERTEQDSAGNFHAMRRRFCELVRRDRSHRVMRNETQQMGAACRGDEKSMFGTHT